MKSICNGGRKGGKTKFLNRETEGGEAESWNCENKGFVKGF